MKKISKHSKTLLNVLKKKKIVTMTELKKILDTQSRMTVFRRLIELNYITSYSHSAKFYSLARITKFNNQGLWFFKSVLFSKHGTLIKSVEFFVNESDNGYTASELEDILKIKVDDVLLSLVRNQKIVREKISGIYVYFSKSYRIRKQQELFRKDSIQGFDEIKAEPEILMNELKAALIMFISLLDEQQRRLYAGLESLKVGHGGDKQIAQLFELNEKTVARGRGELLGNKIQFDTIRKEGGGRKGIQKKNIRGH